MSAALIRSLRAGDEERVARVHIQSWQEAYRGLLPKAYLDALPGELEERLDMWKRILAHPKRWAWVAENKNGIQGFVLFGPGRDENREGFIELGAIYLLAEHKGQGIGAELLKTGFRAMRDLGYRKSYCWVIEGNPTIRFYEKSGARFSGHVKTDEIGGKTFRELAYDWDSIEG